MIPEMTDWQLYLRTSKTEAHRNWLERGKVGEGRINLENKNLTRAVFSGADLADSRFVRCDWSNSNISGDLTEAEISECIWNNSLLYGVHFDRALIERCNFADAYLGITHFIGAKIKEGDWTRCDLDKSTWTDAVVENVCFQRVNFSEARFHGSRFVGCDLRQANLKSATLREAVFENCDFRGAYLHDFVFEKVTFINCGFHNCTGIPAFEGEYIFIEPDLSSAFDGTGIVEQEKLLEQWNSQLLLSEPEITIAPDDSPQWLAHLSRKNIIKHVRWVSAGMEGSPPMDLKGKDLSRAFAYRSYFRAARFTDCDFTSSDLRRSQVQQAEFMGCKFDNALLMYLEGGQKTSLDVKTTKVIFADCTAKGSYFNRSELWIGEFVGGNWDGSYFNNCVWTLVEFENVSFENTDWRGAKLDSVKFVNCSFRKALFHKANIRATEFINCDFRDTNFGFADADKVTMKGCAFCGVRGMFFDIEPLADGEMRILDADFSSNFDGSLVFEPIMRAQDLFNRIGNLPSHEVVPSETIQSINTEESRQAEVASGDTEDLNIAKNPNTPPEQLQALLFKNKENDAVLTAIAVHPNMTKELLIALAFNDDPYDDDTTDYFHLTDQNPVIDLLLLENPNLVEEIFIDCFEALPDFYDVTAPENPFYELSGWAQHSAFLYYLPDWFTENALKHKNEDLRIFVAGRVGGTSERIKQFEEILTKDQSSFVRYAMACSPVVSTSVLEKLAVDEDAEVRKALAENENTPASALFKLLEDEEAFVREAVARNKYAPTSVLEKLLEDEDSDVRETAARNKNISASGLGKS